MSALQFLAVLFAGVAQTSGSEQRLVLRNTLDPWSYGTSGGASLANATFRGPEVLSELTMCLRFYIQVLGSMEKHERAMIVAIADWKEHSRAKGKRNFLKFRTTGHLSVLNVGYPNTRDTYNSYLLHNSDGDYEAIFRPYVWNHMCYMFKKGESRLALNGAFLSVNFDLDTNLRNMAVPLDLVQQVHLMRCRNDYRIDCSAPGSIIADFNIFDEAFAIDRMVKWTTCQDFSSGNVVNWEKAEWKLTNVVKDKMPLEEVCNVPEPIDVLLPEKRKYREHQLMCNKLKGNVTVVRSEEMQKRLIDLFMEKTPFQDKKYRDIFWAGWDDEEKDGNLIASDTGEVLGKDMFSPFYPGEPNGGTLENCIMIWMARDAWNDLNCGSSIMGFCHVQRKPVFKIRGFPPEIGFDDKYTMNVDGYINNRFSFDGYTSTKISFDNNTSSWVMRSLTNPELNASAAVVDYPIGIHTWKVNSPDGVQDMELNLNACDDLSDFTCRDGACVPIRARCDGSDDCNDATDEADCDRIILPENYKHERPPVASAGRKLAKIELSIDIILVLDVAEIESKVEYQFWLTLRWKDARITFKNLKDANFLNTVETEEAKKIWYPRILFYNTRAKQETRYDDKSVMTIDRKGAFKASPKEVLYNNQEYSGKDNDLILSRVYTTGFSCVFDMNHYPFDLQECSMIFVMQGNSGNFTELIMGRLKYKGPVDLTTITDDSIEVKNSTHGLHGVKVEFVFGRRLLNQVSTTFLPTICICLVAFCTNFFQPSNFTPIITVNLTSLLVLTTFFISISNALPKTSYVKLIEVWLVFCLLVPFVEVLLHTTIDVLRNTVSAGSVKAAEEPKVAPAKKGEKVAASVAGAWQSKTKKEKKTRRLLRWVILFGQFGYPLIFLVFCFIFFSYGLSKMSKYKAPEEVFTE